MCIRILMYFCLRHAFKLLIRVGSICSCMLVSCVYIVYVCLYICPLCIHLTHICRCLSSSIRPPASDKAWSVSRSNSLDIIKHLLVLRSCERTPPMTSRLPPPPPHLPHPLPQPLYNHCVYTTIWRPRSILVREAAVINTRAVKLLYVYTIFSDK